MPKYEFVQVYRNVDEVTKYGVEIEEYREDGKPLSLRIAQGYPFLKDYESVYIQREDLPALREAIDKLLAENPIESK